MKIGKTFTFEAAHRLQRHDGKCRNLHGHSYRVDVAIEGPVQENGGPTESNPQEGMVLDFGKLKEWWARLDTILDHRTILESSDPLVSGLIGLGVKVTEFHAPPTAENIAAWLLDDLQNWLVGVWPNGFPTPKVRVWETATSWAEA